MRRSYLLSLVAAALHLASGGDVTAADQDSGALIYVADDSYQRGLNYQTTGANEAPDNSPLETPLASPAQFVGIVSVSAAPLPGGGILSEGLSLVDNADAIDWPRGKNGGGAVTHVLWAIAGAPYSAPTPDLSYGQPFGPPNFDEDLSLLSGSSDDYWRREPHSIDDHSNADYYWSPHAQTPFATKRGSLLTTWRKLTPEASTPPDAGDTSKWFQDTDNKYYRLFQRQYFVQSKPVKPTQTLYWTERGLDTGLFVQLQANQVIKPVFTPEFPETVASEVSFDAAEPATALAITRTFWQENGFIHAYNAQGQIFVEILGEQVPGTTRRVHEGFEIVDVIQQPELIDVTVELGNLVTPYPGQDDPALQPRRQVGNIDGNGVTDTPLLEVGDGSGRTRFYSAAERTPAGRRPFLHWLAEGEGELLWPRAYTRYTLVWPDSSSEYSHYARPVIPPGADPVKHAKNTAVQLPLSEAPFIQYQDSPLPSTDGRRAEMTADFKFYTVVTDSQPVHRTLIRFGSGSDIRFERVFSWRETELFQPQLLKNTIAGDLIEYDRDARDFLPGTLQDRPRAESKTIYVGDRIEAPIGELGTGPDEEYLAGHVHEGARLIHQGFYADPFSDGLEAAGAGAIIPVNSYPTEDQTVIYWFRSNGGGPDAGFENILWPAVVGRYTVAWPTAPAEIVLAGNDGSGALPSLQAKGSIYYENDRNKDGFNPNEEHALMLAGQAFALRDDLNITATQNIGGDFTSEPFVLLQYTEADARPAMRAFKVRREAPELGIAFNYKKVAGQVLQAPMPLPILPKPVPSGQRASVNAEVGDYTVGGNTGYAGGTVTVTTSTDHLLIPYRRYTVQDTSDLAKRRWLVATAGDYGARTLTGIPSPEAPLLLEWQSGLTFALNRPSGLAPGASVVAVSETFKTHANVTVASVTDTEITLNSGPAGLEHTTMLVAADASIAANQFAGWRLAGELIPNFPNNANNASRDRYASYTFEDRKNNLWVYRGAHEAGREGGFEIQFYYATLAGFYFPSRDDDQPGAGTITPYLRPELSAGVFYGDPVDGDHTDGSHGRQSLPIAYTPAWPDDNEIPVLFSGETLTTPKRGLPAMRGQTSLEVFYEQSRATEGAGDAPISVRLHDATREKQFSLDEEETDPNLAKVPDSAVTELFQGTSFFPLLPPHLVERFFFDPNRGAAGALVFKGEFVDEVLGDDYLHLNVLGASDRGLLKGLVDAADANKAKWDAAIDGLSTDLETFYENPAKPGEYIPNPALTVTAGSGALSAVTDDDMAVDSYALSVVGPGRGYISIIAGNGEAFTPTEEPVSVLILKVSPNLYRGEIKVVTAANPLSEKLTLQQVVDLAADTTDYTFDWRFSPPIDGLPPSIDFNNDNPGADWLMLDSADYPEKLRANWGGTADVKTLSDNYVIMRYGRVDVNDADNDGNTSEMQWSTWTDVALAEGWIKRVLAGINPFNQRVTDLFNNQIDTSGSILEQAGKRWEGDVALSLENINDVGLIEIYETVLRRGRGLSIDADINYGPANDALLLAAGYINDLYMIVGNEAYADALNPTIGIGTADTQFGDVATSQFSFSGQVPTLLEEELGLLRGRDDFLLPGVEVTPVYNRMVWNYTRGINAGEVIYALNYNIKDDQGDDLDGSIDAADAARMFPQGHGDAYGHYLTAMKGYYELLVDDDFSWAPRIEAVNVLGKPVSVDYFDERKFAAAASAVARTGKQTFDLTWRKDFERGSDTGWDHFEETRENDRRLLATERHWGVDHWAGQTGQGALVNWVVGNAMLPAVDPDPTHEGIQKVDRTTVPELNELVAVSTDLQNSLDNANAHMNPLGLSENSVPFDISPLGMGLGTNSHFGQMNVRAKMALNNAVSAFDDAKDVSRFMRSEQDQLVGFQAEVDAEELAYKHRLIELFGTPYPDDIGPGKTYVSGFDGPDLLHFMYADLAELGFGDLIKTREPIPFKLDIQNYAAGWNEGALSGARLRFDFVTSALSDPEYASNVNDALFVEYELGAHGFFGKPDAWTGKRASPGEIQQAISDVVKARNLAYQALQNHLNLKYALDREIELFRHGLKTRDQIDQIESELEKAHEILLGVQFATGTTASYIEFLKGVFDRSIDVAVTYIPENLIAGVSVGGSVGSVPKGAVETVGAIADTVTDGLTLGLSVTADAFALGVDLSDIWVPRNQIMPLEDTVDDYASVWALDTALGDLQFALFDINKRLQEFDDAQAHYKTLLARGDRIQMERQVFRQRAAGIIQGYRTRDAAFRIFRNEKLERYNTLFDLAARYAYLAAQSFDYETGLLHTEEGRRFVERIVRARALGVVSDGEPQFGGSNLGDPGLSSVLAEMAAEWQVLEGRLGINNPDSYATTASLRLENLRILPGAEGDELWQDHLQASRYDDILQDADVKRYCMQVDAGDGLPVPGFIIEFQTTISDGRNMFGRSAAAGDHIFNPTSFATKIFSSGIVLEGYRGMDDPNSNATTTGGASPGDPSVPFLDQDALLATPFIYLVPVGLDTMRSPPLGDRSVLRGWNVEDVTVPLPFNLGANDFSSGNNLQSAGSLTEPLFGIRKHQAFRPVSTAAVFANDNGSLLPSFYTNSRLIGRSVWNSKWKIVIPGKMLLNDPEEGMERFIRTVKDIKLHFETYSYSGN
jgi:hypothetical protein